MESKRQLTAEEEAMRRNTDCIYFLASPLTCKKGSECEFRHSEAARVNPRECWYWLNSNCLNPKCGFRHPPLDVLFENPHPPAGQAGLYNNNPNKQNIPCFYFQKGQCIKGDKCPFMHGFNPVTDNASQQVAIMPHEDPQDATKVSSSLPSDSHTTNSRGLKECTTQLTIPKLSVAHSMSASKLDNVPKKCSSSLDYELPRSQPISSDSTSSKPLHHHHSPPTEEHYTNGLENEDFLRESSPGFDVLVDVDGEEYVPREPEFYNNDYEDDYGGRSKLNPNPNPDQSVDEFDYINPDYNYEPMASYEKDEYNRRMHHEWGRDNHRLIESTPKRRSVHRDLSPVGNITGSDLRHSLLKKRRVNGHHSEHREREVRHADYRYQDPSFRRNAHLSQEMMSISPRLQGRIKLPPNRGRMNESEGRSRLRGRMNHHVRNVEERRRKRDDADPLSFPGPKSLAELKGTKVSGSSPTVRSVIESFDSNGDGGVGEAETSMKKKDGGEDEGMENFDMNDGDCEYEGNKGEDFKALDEENAYEDEENACLDDDDEFEKKVKGLFS